MSAITRSQTEIHRGDNGMTAPPQPVMRVQTSYATAMRVQVPRSLPDVERRLMEEADLGGESFYYGWGAGKDVIEGPSVNLANAAARCWGNCAVELLPVQETDDSWIFTASFVDLETGFTLPRQFRQSKKWTVYGKLDEQRKDDIRFQIGQSKAIRNVILNAVPEGLINKAMARAKAGVAAEIERLIKSNGIVKVVEVALRNLAKLGVKEESVLRKFGVAARTGLDIDHLVIIKGDLLAIEAGRDYAKELYPDEDSKTAASGTDAVRGALASKTAQQPKTDDQSPTTGGEQSRGFPQEPTPEMLAAPWPAFVGTLGALANERNTYANDGLQGPLEKWQKLVGLPKRMPTPEQKTALYKAVAAGKLLPTGEIEPV